MNINLEELEKLGEIQFSIYECAIVMKLDPNELEKEMQENTETKNAYERGKLKASAEVRKAILTQAKQGSSPAQKQMLELIDKANGKAKQKFQPKRVRKQ